MPSRNWNGTLQWAAPILYLLVAAILGMWFRSASIQNRAVAESVAREIITEKTQDLDTRYYSLSEGKVLREKVDSMAETIGKMDERQREMYSMLLKMKDR